MVCYNCKLVLEFFLRAEDFQIYQIFIIYLKLFYIY